MVVTKDPGHKPGFLLCLTKYTMLVDLAIKTRPTSEPVTVDEIADHVRLNPGDTFDDKSTVEAYSRAAVKQFQARADVTLITTTWLAHYDSWDYHLRLPRPPVTTVSSVKYYDTNDSQQTLSSSNYTLEGSRVVFKTPCNLPALTTKRLHKVTVEYVAGYTPTTVPHEAKVAVWTLVALLYDRREPIANGQVVKLPYGFDSVCDMFGGSKAFHWGR